MAIFIILFGQLPIYSQHAEAATGRWLNFKFDEFPEDTFNQSFTVNGAAEVPQGQNFIRLTSATTQQSGSVFNNTALCPRDNYSFSTAFSFQMSNTSPNGPSDGLTFTIQSGKTSQHAEGGGLGYYGITPSFAVKYDTFLNTVYQDPSANYVGLAVNGTVTNDQPGWFTDLNSYNTANNTNYVLSNGTQYYTWIEYDGSSQNVQVRLGTSPDRASSQIVLDVNDIDLNAIFGGQSFYAGFTGSTGSPNYETHDIHSWYFVNEYAPIETLDPNNDYKVNEPPTAPDDTKATAVNTPVSGQVNGTDPDGDPLTYTKGTDPGNGTVTVEEDGNWTYTPPTDFVGKDSFTVIINDGKCAKTEATITVDVSDSTPPTTPPNVCGNPVALINGSFEGGPARGSYTNPIYFLESEVPGWQTTDDSQGVKIIEIWNYALGYPNGVRNLPAPPDGNRYAELNAFDNGLLYQDVETTPGQTIYWRLSHMGRGGVDTMQLRIGQATNDPYDTQVIRQMSDGNRAWGTYSGTYTVPAGQTVTRFGFEAVSTASGSIGAGNFLDDIFLGTEPCIEAEKSVSPAGKVFVGDELTYEVNIKNAGGDISADTVFEDAIPVGTEYVPGSMKIVSGPNAGNLTDADDQDAGHFDGDKVTIRLGDLANTKDLPNGITVQFRVKALSNRAGDSVANKATVGYKNLLTDEDGLKESNEVSTPVEYREHDLEAEKTAELFEKAAGNTDAGNPEVGDTLQYTIQTRNTVEDSLVTNLTITDEVPAGLEYVPGTLKVDDAAVTDAEGDDKGHFADGKVSAQFGDVTDTDWHKVTFQVKVLPGQAGKDIRNVAVVDGDNVNTPNTPEEVVEVYPRETALESTKTSELHEKATGNTDAAHPEVGDTLLYTIQTRNTVADSLVTNLTISDEIPAGLEYVTGTLKVNDVAVTDAKGDDAGHFADGKIFAEFGDVTDTVWHQVTFQVKVLPGQAGKDIRNVAVVDGDNVNTPSTPEEVVEVYPRETSLESTKTSELHEKAAGNTDTAHAEVGDTLQYTIQTRNTVTDSLVTNLTITDEIPAGLEYAPGTLKVNDVPVTDDQDGDKGHFANGKVFASFGDVTDTAWEKVTFQVKILPGQANKDIRNVAVVDGDNINTPSTPEEVVEVYPRDIALESTKTSELLEKAAGNTDAAHPEIGDTLLYTIQARNTASDSLVTNLTISDEIPAGLEYVAGTLKVDDAAVTDAEGDDTGHFANGKVFASFGDVTDTQWHKVTFQVKVLPGQAGKNIINIAAVDGDNVGTPDRPRNEVEVYPRNPQIETEKSVANNVSKATYEVGDTITYTIRVRGVVNDTYLENLTITDTLPVGLEYVPGSLKVDGVTVTDPKDDDAGHSVTGDVYGSFGNVKDTEWHALEFQAIILPGQGGLTIQNTARVTGDNIDQPGEPTEKLVVEPEPPVVPPVEPPVEPPVDPPVDPGPPVNPPTDPGNGTNPTDPGNGTNPTDPGNGTNPTDPGNGTNPTDPGNGTNPTDPGNGTNPTDPGNGTNPTDPGDGTNPTDPGNDTDTGGSGDNTTSPPQSGGDSSSGENDGAQSPSDEITGEESTVPAGALDGNKLPNTATNLYNLGFIGMIMLLAGLLLRRRNKV